GCIDQPPSRNLQFLGWAFSILLFHIHLFPFPCNNNSFFFFFSSFWLVLQFSSLCAIHSHSYSLSSFSFSSFSLSSGVCWTTVSLFRTYKKGAQYLQTGKT